ncbi:uncharacterized protein BDR25DRAFT_353075 [Lindgomyces ingoldianus]|uniref:Uncharacterized protein n=1 Tax=Lindgomyces ingoldianus TaxID=673940 RepID=A0ACB6R0H5_9PLEO|nr:uncharacterized protein BDR25DRAFT_353075 [Lindgomyces ingoldianus]KAF2472753.1 hypothetical protein BDR25DRAFT_353075 [Lindgomyces ingoldianus]
MALSRNALACLPLTFVHRPGFNDAGRIYAAMNTKRKVFKACKYPNIFVLVSRVEGSPVNWEGSTKCSLKDSKSKIALIFLSLRERHHHIRHQIRIDLFAAKILYLMSVLLSLTNKIADALEEAIPQIVSSLLLVISLRNHIYATATDVRSSA